MVKWFLWEGQDQWKRTVFSINDASWISTHKRIKLDFYPALYLNITSKWWLYVFIYLFLPFCLFWGHTHGIWGFPGQGSNWSYSRRPTPRPQQRRIQAASSTYPTGHSSARSLTHWARSGIKPATTWFLVRFVNHWATMGTPKMMDLNVRPKMIKFSFYIIRRKLHIIEICSDFGEYYTKRTVNERKNRLYKFKNFVHWMYCPEEFPSWLSGLWLASMRTQFWFLAFLSGLRIQFAMSYGIGHRRGSDPVWLWLWPVAQEPPCSAGVALKRQAKFTIHRIKMQCIEWDKIFANHISDKGLISKTYKETSITQSQ